MFSPLLFYYSTVASPANSPTNPLMLYAFICILFCPCASGCLNSTSFLPKDTPVAPGSDEYNTPFKVYSIF